MQDKNNFLLYMHIYNIKIIYIYCGDLKQINV